MTRLSQWIIFAFSALGLLLTVNQTFLFSRAIGVVINGQTFLYVLTLVFFPIIFLIMPRAARVKERSAYSTGRSSCWPACVPAT